MNDSLIDSAGGDTTTVDTGIPDPTSTTPAPDFSFYADGGISPAFDKMLGDNKSARSHFQKYAGAENPFDSAMNGIKDLNYIAGQKERTRPADDASDEDKKVWNDYLRNQLGVPEKPEGYGWERPESVPEEMWDQEGMDKLAGIAHQHNVSPQAASALFEEYNAQLAAAPEQMAAQEAQELQVQRDLLNNKFGMEADKMIKQAAEAGNLKGLSESEISRIAQTAEGVELLASMKNWLTSDVTSNTQSSEGIRDGGGSNYQDKAMEAGRLAVEAHNRGDMASYKKYAEQQSHYNQAHSNASR